MAYHNGKQNGFIEHNGYNIDKVLHNGNCVFNQGFDKDNSGTDSVVCDGTIGKDLMDWSIVGNTVQNGVPSPENPIEVKGVGDRTDNLLDTEPFTIKQGINNNYVFATKYLNKGIYTVSLLQETVLSSCTRNCIAVEYDGITLFESTTSNYHLASGLHTYTFTISNDSTKVKFRYWGHTLSNDTTYSNIMLNEGSIPLSYEPYGVKIPVVSRGKNLFDSDILLNATGWVKNGDVYSGRNSTLHSAFNGFNKCIPIKANRVIISLKFKYTSVATSLYVMFYYKDGTLSQGFVNGALNEWTTLIIFSEANKELKGFAFSYGMTSNMELKDIQVESGTALTEYTPYRPPVTTTQYLPTPLMKDERLTPTAREVKWGKYEFTGNEVFGRQAIGHVNILNIYIAAKDLSGIGKPYGEVYTSITKYSDIAGVDNDTVANISRMNTSGTNMLIDVSLNDFSDITVFKTFLKSEYDAGHPVTVWYQLATPTTEPVTTTPIGTLRNEEKTIKGTTTIITTDTEVLPTQIEASYKSNKVDYVVVNYATADGNIFTTANGDTYTIKMRKSQYDTMMTNELLSLLEVM